MRLTRILHLWHQCFPHAVVRELLICLETGGHRFRGIADGVLSHANFGVLDIYWLRTIYNAQIERPCVLHSLESLGQSKLEEPHWIGFSAVGGIHNLWRSSSPDRQIAASCFGWTFAELYDFSAIFLLSYHKVHHVHVVVFLATSKPSCSVKFLKFTLVSTLPLKYPSWPFSDRADSSSGVNGCA